jgi:hypothetical protein
MGALLGRRRGKPTAAGIDRGWPHQVVVPATECTSSHGRFMEAFRLDLSVCERHHSVFHEDKWWIVYCFADPEHAKKFRVRFAANGSIRKIEAAAPAGRGGTRMDAERLLSFDADASTTIFPCMASSSPRTPSFPSAASGVGEDGRSAAGIAGQTTKSVQVLR